MLGFVLSSNMLETSSSGGNANHEGKSRYN
jgi:hypothetical protein